MKLGVLIALAVVSVLLLFVSIYFGSKNFKYRTKSNFSFLNVFPCEFNITDRFFDNFYGNIFSIISCILSIAFFCTYPSSFEGLLLPILAFGILTSILNILAPSCARSGKMRQVPPLRALLQGWCWHCRKQAHNPAFRVPKSR